jgi:hypothetical protein
MKTVDYLLWIFTSHAEDIWASFLRLYHQFFKLDTAR